MSTIQPAANRFIVQGDPDRIGRLQAEGLGYKTRDLALIGGASVTVDAEKADAFRARAAELGLAVRHDGRVGIPIEKEAEPVEPGQVGVLLEQGPKLTGIKELWEQGLRGAGVTVAVIDTGVAPHRDLEGRIVGFKDLVNGRTDPYDDHGHGTHVSGTVAGDGKASLGVLKGVAPEANIVGIKVLDGGGSGTFADVIAGIQWAVENKDRYNIKVINLSLGAYVTESWKDDPVCQAIEAATQAGVLPVIAAGNSGPFGETIGTPANSPSALTVGAMDDRNTPWTWDDGIPFFSSRGPTAIDGLAKPDVVAPGTGITAPMGGRYSRMSGTSMASPHAAGVAAVLFQAHPDATPAEVKEALMETAHPLFGHGTNAQGRGLVDAAEAHEALGR